MKNLFDYLLIDKKNKERGIYLPYTIISINILLIFFLIQIDMFYSINTFYHFTSNQNKLDRAYSRAIFDLKHGEIPLQSNIIKYYNNTKIVWNFKSLTYYDYFVVLTSSNSKIKKHVIQFKYKKSTNQVYDWTD